MDHDAFLSLQRFLDAQSRNFDDALAELRAGQKSSHWMWYVFPQLRGLGRADRARFYGIADLEEARAYLHHEVLFHRLEAVCTAILIHRGTPAEQILGPVDAQKLGSSMTLFELAGPGPFAKVLEAFHGGQRDAETLRLLGRG